MAMDLIFQDIVELAIRFVLNLPKRDDLHQEYLM